MSQYASRQSFIRQEPWPQPWGEDPIEKRGYEKLPDSFNRAISRSTRQGKDPVQWEALWAPGVSWTESVDHPNDAVDALRACLYCASKGNEVHTLSLVNAFRSGLFPSAPMDLWSEDWMRESLASFLVESPPASPAGELAALVLDQWPWLFGWSGQLSQNYKHPVARAVRRGNHDFAVKMLEKIPAETWLDWGDHYEMRGIWRDQAHWFRQDASWIARLAALDPRFLHVDPKKGIGPLETAAKDHLPELVQQLLAQGIRPDPSASFGLTLSHWAAFGMSEERWNAKIEKHEPKTPQDVASSAEACGKTLGMLDASGYSMHAPVEKVEKVPGVRRPKGLPKYPLSAYGHLDKMIEGGTLRPDTMTIIQQSSLSSQTHAAPEPALSSGPRKRL